MSGSVTIVIVINFNLKEEERIRDIKEFRGLGNVYKRKNQEPPRNHSCMNQHGATQEPPRSHPGATQGPLNKEQPSNYPEVTQ